MFLLFGPLSRTLVPKYIRPPKHVSPLYSTRRCLATLSRENENINVVHSRFLAEGSTKAKWKNGSLATGSDGLDSAADDAEHVSEGKGKLSPTSSHLFKLIIPMDKLLLRDESHPGLPTVFLLHPSQPLSHISRLIASSLAPEIPSISFRSASPHGKRLEWSDSTDVGDFIRDAARANVFEIHIRGGEERTVQIEVPTFEDRTRFLRRKLGLVERDLQEMDNLKKHCDDEARRGARRMAVGGLGMLVVYWGTVARLTFWDLGWDVMEPVTYLSGLSMVILGYLWFLYQGREVSYTSVLDRSVSTRRYALYESRGFDIDRWIELVSEAKTLRKEISKIAEDYDERRWTDQDDERDAKQAQADEEVKEVRETTKQAESSSNEADEKDKGKG